MGSDIICRWGRLYHVDGTQGNRPGEQHLGRVGAPRGTTWTFAQALGVTVSPFLVEKGGSRLPRSCVEGWNASPREDFLEEEYQQAHGQSSLWAPLC